MPYYLAPSSEPILDSLIFLLISSGLAFMLYLLLTQPSVYWSKLRGQPVRKIIAAPVAVVIWILVAPAIHVRFMASFRTITVGNDAIRLDYTVPSRSVTLPYGDIAEVVPREANTRGRRLWRLEIYTRAEARYRSARASHQQIQAVADAVERRRQH